MRYGKAATYSSTIVEELHSASIKCLVFLVSSLSRICAVSCNEQFHTLVVFSTETASIDGNQYSIAGDGVREVACYVGWLEILKMFNCNLMETSIPLQVMG